MSNFAQRFTKRQVRNLRRIAKKRIDENSPICAIKISGLPESCGYVAKDDTWDRDGDSITAHCINIFEVYSEPFVHAIFSRGTDPQMVGRMLRKMADMMAGPEGEALANLQGLDLAKRFDDGQVGFDLSTSGREWTFGKPDET